MPQPTTIAEILKRASEQLRAASVPNDLLDAQTLLAHALDCDRTYLIVNFNQRLSGETIAKYQSLIARRATGEPLQYITGHQEFFGLEFEVTPDVLIPRPETELIVEETLRLVGQQLSITPDWQPVIVDIGTGSGCIAVTLARELETVCDGARIMATDVSMAALLVARRNAARHGLTGRVEFAAMNLLDAFSDEPFADFIISNPPYVAESEMPALQREVRDWEPRLALTDFADGFSFYRRLLSGAPARLRPGGHLICEVGYGQAATIRPLVNDQVWDEVRVLEDLQSIPRTIVARRR
ncbi:MAG TPA: peptide chain release factor N(5)-glutamine methyltransferase [Blastocatellia bacterium]|nr:peptide chain release factor N(5)-glutamine methyltransferase [Blastocatellia bacterium]